MKSPLRLFSALCLIAVFLLVPSPASAQFSKLNDLSAEFAKKLKGAKPHMIAVADFTNPDGSPSTQGDYFAWYVTTSLSFHVKKLPVADHAEFKAALAKHNLTPRDLVSPEGLKKLAAQINVDFIITGSVDLSKDDYTLHVVAQRINDASVLAEKTIQVQRTEFTDSLTEPFPPIVNFPVVKAMMPSGSSGQSQMPKCLYCPNPDYSDQARREKLQGTVIFEVLVSAKGEPLKIHPLKLLGYGLDERAFYTLKTWHFQPATSPDGTPVAVIVPIEVTFRLY
jgi:TonB family protein